MTTDENGNNIVVGGYEYRIFDAISKKLKYVGFDATAVQIKNYLSMNHIFIMFYLLLTASNMIYLYQSFVACGEVLQMTKRQTLLALLAIF